MKAVGKYIVITDVEEKTKEIKEQLTEVEEENSQLRTDIKTLKSQMTKLKTQLDVTKETSHQALAKANYNEQYSRKNSVKIMNIK